ncbi:MAG: pyridoxal phosphate-dependent aminotransferase [Spirochaetales bacterium]|nr:pyridoxal phosphate-dependent aminotransferase [Spirochaetales bacterium]
MQPSKRIQAIAASPIRKLSPYADFAKSQGKKVYHLNIGQPDIKTPENVIKAIQNFDHEVLAYGPSEGLHAYRNALPSYYKRYNIDIVPEDILVTTAGSEAILFTLLAVCDPGDEIIVPEPFYTNYGSFASMAGVTIVPLTTRIEDNFKLPAPADFEKKITEKTRAILICSPSNPTGGVYPRESIEKLVNVVKNNDIFLIADEVYREFIFDGITPLSILDFQEITDRAIVVDSVSKRFSMCGARIGSIISRNHELLGQILKLGQARLCPPTIAQIAAKAAIDTPDSYGKAVIVEYQKRRDVAYESLSSIPGVVTCKPHGAFYMIAKLPVDDAEKFAIFMLRDFSLDNETVMITPAAGFYRTPGLGIDEIRLAFVLNEKDLRRSAELLREGLKAYRCQIT